MHPNYRSVAFLLSLGALPIACGKLDKDGDSDTDTTGAGTGSTGATDPVTTSQPGETTTTGEDTGSTGPAPTTTTAPTSSTSAETGEPPPDPICQAYAAHHVECFPRDAMYEADFAVMCTLYKDHAAMLDGPACKEAYEASLVCLTNTDCAELDNEPPDLPCEPEAQAEAEACPSSFP